MFEKFVHTGKSYTPKVSINPRGFLGFNQGAKNRFSISEYTYAVMYYDKERRLIGIEMITDGAQEGAVKVRPRETGADIGGKSFLSYYEILPEKTMLYPIERGEHSNWMVIDLNKGRERKTSLGDDEDDDDDLGVIG